MEDQQQPSMKDVEKSHETQATIVGQPSHGASPTPQSTKASSSISDRLVLPTLIFSQFAGTSLWFAPNAVITQVDTFVESQISTLVICVQVGFILGTLLLTITRAADRIVPPILFLVMTLMGSGLNLLCIATTSFGAWACLRLGVGVCLAGVYPVGMKIAAMEYPRGLGARLGVLVGALTLGTAFPWLVRGVGDESGLPFEATLGAVSALAAVGALLLAGVMLPRQSGYANARKVCSCCFYSNNVEEEGYTESCVDLAGTSSKDSMSSAEVDVVETDATKLRGWSAVKLMFQSTAFRASVWGYFGHQWELYTMWTFVPVLIDSYSAKHGGVMIGNEAIMSFVTIGIGAVSCTVAGVWSLYAGRNILPGSAVVAMSNLTVSLLCCLVVPAYQYMSQGVFLAFVLIWGWAVIADSAQFSSLTATYACKELLGTSLTLATCLGYTVTVISIQIIGALLQKGWDPGNALALLAIGPVLGLARTYKEWPLHHLWTKKE